MGDVGEDREVRDAIAEALEARCRDRHGAPLHVSPHDLADAALASIASLVVPRSEHEAVLNAAHDAREEAEMVWAEKFDSLRAGYETVVRERDEAAVPHQACIREALRRGTVDPRERTLELHDTVCEEKERADAAVAERDVLAGRVEALEAEATRWAIELAAAEGVLAQARTILNQHAHAFDDSGPYCYEHPALAELDALLAGVESTAPAGDTP